MDLDRVFSSADVVIHLAAITDAESSFDKKELIDRINLQGTERVARACAKMGCGMIYASTTSVYGVSDGEVDETCMELKPQSPYAESKLKAERMLATIDGLRYIILRMGTIFGVSEGMRFHTAVNKFCLQASLGQPITVWRTALNQNRPYLDLSDMVRAVKFIIAMNLFNKEVYNLVTVNTTVQDILDIIRTTNIEYVDSPIMNQLSYTVSSDKFKNLGFEFNGDIVRGINETMELLS